MPQSIYKPGLHIVSTFSAPVELLRDAVYCRELFDGLIGELGLVKVGEVYHSFPQGGYTAIVALTESHVSIHTWPEFGMATFDVFLSSFMNDNTEKVRAFFDATVAGFRATVTNRQEIMR